MKKINLLKALNIQMKILKTLKENDEASTVNEEHIDSDATSENQPTNNVEMKKANLSQITSENQNTANINAEEDNDNFQLPSKEKDIISNVDDTTEGVKGDIIDELDKPNTSKTSKDDFNKQSTVHTKSSEYKHNVESENAKDKIIDVQTSQNAPSMTKAYSQSSKEPIGKKEDRKTLRQTRSTQLTAMPKARRNFKTSPNISTREATEDNSLETLPYSDNYTFQSLIFDPENLTEKKVLNSKVIPFKIHSYLTGANSGDRYKINLQLDPYIADHVKRITIKPANRENIVTFNRVINDVGKKTNIWQINYIRANGGLFGGAEILSQYTAEGGRIELDDTVKKVLAKVKNLDNDKMNYLIYVKDSLENKKIRTSESSGYFLTLSETTYNNLKHSKSVAANSAFKASSGSVQYDPSIGEFGGLVADQQIMKNGIFNYGGPLLDLGLNKQWTYNYKIDPELLPFIESLELHRYDFEGVSGFDKKYYENNKVANLTVDSQGHGSISAENLNTLIEFNNALPETVGIRIVAKFNQSPNNILTRESDFDDQDGNLIGQTSKIKEDFTFYGYLTDRDGGMIDNTFGTSSYYIQDIDQDGLTDNFEIHKSLSDPMNQDTDNDGKKDGEEYLIYKTSPLVGRPIVSDITTDETVVSGNVYLAPNAVGQIAKVLNEKGEEIGRNNVEPNGDFTIDIANASAGKYTIAIESPHYDNDEISEFNIIDMHEILKPTLDPITDADKEITIHGIEGATVTLQDDNGNIIGSAKIEKGKNDVSIKLIKPLAAGTIVTALAEKDGTESYPSDLIIVSDGTPPTAPTVNQVTSEDTEIRGTVEAGSTVKVILPSGVELITEADDEGNYIVDLPENEKYEGGEVLQVTAVDASGNESELVEVVIEDKTPPTAPTVNQVTSEDSEIHGTAEPGSTVKVTLPSGQELTTEADDEGNYTIDLPENEKYEGGEVLQVTATDEAGNESKLVEVVIEDKTPPTAPTVNQVTSEDTEIHGTAEPGSTVKVTLPSGQELTTEADDEGNYSVDLPENEKYEGGEVLQVTATDEAGNESELVEVVIEDKTPPTAPTVNQVTSEDTEIRGTAEPGSTVKVTLPSGQELTTEADDEGNYIVDLPENEKYEGGEVLQVTAVDASGNESEVVEVVIEDKTPPAVPTVNQVTSEDTEVSGTAEPGSTVKVTLPSGQELTTETDDEGNYSIDLPENEKYEGGEVLQITAVDASGNESELVEVVIEDKTPPTAPTVNQVTSEDTEIHGTAEPGSTVKVTLPSGQELTTEADDEGNYSVDLPENEKYEGGEVLQVTATDEAGNESELVEVVIEDKTPPTAPTVNQVTSEDTEIHGIAEPGSTVKVTLPSGQELTTEADDEGNYSVDLPENEKYEGGEVLQVTAIDASGNESEEREVLIEDKTPPTAPTVNQVTSEDTEIRGTAEPGATVKVTLPNGQELTTEADDQGNYSIDLPENEKYEGGETLQVTATDEAGNESEENEVVIEDKTPPTAPTVNQVTSEDTEIRGTAEPGATVKVTLPSGQELTTKADDEGNYIVDLPENEKYEGGEVLQVTAVDASGNESEVVEVVIEDKTPPTAPTVNQVTSESPQVSGTAEPGATVKVTLPSGQELTTEADDEGNYSVDLPENEKYEGGEVLQVTATDEAGNESEENEVLIEDKTPPRVPTVNQVTSEDTEIRGTAEPGSTVKVLLPNGQELTTEADDEGNYSIDLPENEKYKGGEVLQVTSTDEAGNESEENEVVIEDKTPPTVPTVNQVTSEDTEVSGTAEPGSIVKVILPSGQELTAEADDEGNYSVGLPENEKYEGGEVLQVTAVDASGNESEENEVVIEDKTPPAVPTVNQVTSESPQVSGTAEPGSTVKVTLPSGQELTTEADDEGNYIVDLPENEKYEGGEVLQVIAVDASGNESEVVEVVIEDKTPPTAPTVNQVTSESPQVSGTAEPGATVKVTLPSGQELTTEADDEGNYSVDLPENEKYEGGEVLQVTATDEAGNESEENEVLIEDKTPPRVPTVNQVTSEDTEIRGTAEPGSTVKVLLPNGQELTTEADDEGNYSIDLPENEKYKGGEVLQVTSTDEAGNESEENEVVIEDKTPPTVPTVNQVTSEDTEVSGTAEPGSIVKVILPSGQELTAEADDEGNYSVGLPENEKYEGGEVLQVTAVDASGNESEENEVVIEDKTPPAVPTVNQVTSESPQVSGTAEPGSTVKVTLPSGQELTTEADDEGNYIVDLPENEKYEGGEVLQVTSVDASGNESEVVEVVIEDKTPPTAPTVNQVTSESPQVSGTAEPGATVIIVLPNEKEIKHVVDNNGHFVITLPKDGHLHAGDIIMIQAIDKNGNASEHVNMIVKRAQIPISNQADEPHKTKQINHLIDKTKNNNIDVPDQLVKVKDKDAMKNNIMSLSKQNLERMNQDNATLNSSNRKESIHRNKQLPKTGINYETHSMLLSSLFVTIGTLLLLGKRRKKTSSDQ
ncbi:Ig-like domain-containing protein [Staphylococcus succinus]|uniref:Ig-like domain-containing protein n=1 Tax=Staphylococcus succinus TaxID=61015 RepID=UPI001F543707